MAFTTPDTTKRQPGKAILADNALEDAANLIDLDSRTNLLEGGANKVPVFNDLITNAAQWAPSSTFTGLDYFKATAGFTLVSAVVTQFEAGSTGSVEIDILKASGPNETFTSVFNTKPSVFSQGSDVTVVDYTQLSGDTLTLTINGSANVLTEGVDWTAATSNNATASSLQAAVTALTGVTVAAPGAAVLDLQADNTYQVSIISSDGTNLSVGQSSIAGDNTKSNNADFGTTSVSQGDYLRIDISAFQSVQKKFHVEITGEVS